MTDEVERLRKLIRDIACQTDPTWSRQLARDEVGLGSNDDLPEKHRPMQSFTGYLAVLKKTGRLPSTSTRAIRVNRIARWHLMGNERCAKVRVVEIIE